VARVPAATSPLWFSAREAVATETPAARATSLMVTNRCLGCWKRLQCHCKRFLFEAKGQ
jgi:hypothetical protein